MAAFASESLACCLARLLLLACSKRGSPLAIGTVIYLFLLTSPAQMKQSGIEKEREIRALKSKRPLAFDSSRRPEPLLLFNRFCKTQVESG